MKKSRHCGLAAVILALSCMEAQAQMTFTPLGYLPGKPVTYASDVTADGSVVVGVGRIIASGGPSEAFRWTSGGGMVGLGDLPGGNYQSGASGVSADGSVVVGGSVGIG